MNDTATEVIEATVCEACQLVPLTHLTLDLDDPIAGWQAMLGARGVAVVLDDVGRPAVRLSVLRELLAEHREREAREEARWAEQAAGHKVLVPAGVPAQEGSTLLESMMLAPGYTSAQAELGGGRVSPTQEFMDAQFAEARWREAEARAELQLVEQARRVLEGSPPKGRPKQ